MSSLYREPPSGLIKQETRIIGSICLPGEHTSEFIDEFNDCYGPLRLRIQAPDPALEPQLQNPLPVGARRRSTERPS